MSTTPTPASTTLPLSGRGRCSSCSGFSDSLCKCGRSSNRKREVTRLRIGDKSPTVSGRSVSSPQTLAAAELLILKPDLSIQPLSAIFSPQPPSLHNTDTPGSAYIQAHDESISKTARVTSLNEPKKTLLN